MKYLPFMTLVFVFMLSKHCLLRSRAGLFEVARLSNVTVSDLELAPRIPEGILGELVRASHFVQLLNCQDQHSSQPAWAKKDLNFRPHAYQACALTN